MEIDHLLSVSEGQLVTYNKKEESAAKIRWWLATPEGQVYGNPKWGNRLIQFKHDPISVSTEVSIEAHIFNKMRQDLPLVQIRGIRVKCIDAQETVLLIETQEGLIKTTFDRANTQ